MNTILEVKKRLLCYNIKPSQQRIAVMQYLMEVKTHPTVDMIFKDLSPLMPTLSRTTVYNTLKLLAEQGAIKALSIDDKNMRYDGDITTHAHFWCKQCGQVYDLPSHFAQGIGQMHDATATGLHITECQVYYKGYCKNCKQPSNNKN